MDRTSKPGRGHVFNDPVKKAELFSLRADGYSVHQLARYFGVDHTTLLYHFKKAGIIPISYDLKQQVIKAIKDGMTMRQAARKYAIAFITVASMCVSAGMTNILQTPIPGSKKLVLRILPRWGNWGRPKKVSTELKKYKSLIKHSERPGWYKRKNGTWICEGKSFVMLQKEQREKQKQVEAERRAKMLLY